MDDVRNELKDYATEYTIGNYKLAWRGKDWAITDGNLVYNKKTKELVYEPMPSSRSDNFLKNCRFELDEAKNIVNKLNKKHDSHE